MGVAAAILALVALILLFLLLVARRNAAAERKRSRVELESLDSRLTEATEARVQAEHSATEAELAAEAVVAEARQRAEEAAQRVSEADERAAIAQGALDERVEKVSSLERYSVELQGQLSNAAAELETQRNEAASLRAAVDTATARADRLVGETDGVLLGGIDPDLLWSLELVRSERTWRHSVAVDPSAPSPFPDAPDPLKFAVEVEAAAMREEVGSFITLDWKAEAVSNPARRLLILRVANELLAAAAREPQPFTMVATGAEEIEIHLSSSEDGDEQLNLDPPRFGSDVIDFHKDETGVRVIIR